MLFNLFTRNKKKPVAADTTADATVEPVAPQLITRKSEVSAAAATPTTTPTVTSIQTPTAEPVATAPSVAEAELPQQQTPASADLVAPESHTAAETNKPVATLTVPQLRLRAKEMGITGYSRLTKADLVRVITDHKPL
ncbi:MAG TPA: Rho termination factor N-terminal domain-containing protein [Glaciihabitans sp.]|nr:Rho termination factor N-terminal domain-containing protein [Glaciihabitans sp.]